MLKMQKWAWTFGKKIALKDKNDFEVCKVCPPAKMKDWLLKV